MVIFFVDLKVVLLEFHLKNLPICIATFTRYYSIVGLVYIQGMSEPGADPYSQVKSMDKRRAEPEKIRIWREEQAELLKKKGVFYFQFMCVTHWIDYTVFVLKGTWLLISNRKSHMPCQTTRKSLILDDLEGQYTLLWVNRVS